MRGIDGDRFLQNETIAIALVPSRRDQVPETLARLGRSCRKISMSGQCGGSLIIRCGTQARASAKRTGCAACVSFDTRRPIRLIWRCRKPARGQARPTLDRAAQTGAEWYGQTWKLGNTCPQGAAGNSGER